MTVVLSASEINRIEIFSWWVGFGDPTSRAAKLTITNSDGRWLRQEALEPSSDELPHPAISRLLEMLARPAMPRLIPTSFDLPAEAIDWHYGSCWDDDHPAVLVRVIGTSGRQITALSEAQQAFMLPFTITDSVTDASYDTYDPELSRALADLMPDGFLEKNRLAGQEPTLELDRAEFERRERETVAAAGPATNVDAFDAMVTQILSGDEAAEETSEKAAEGPSEEAQAIDRAARLSRRLLNWNTLETMKDLLARGADPSIADDEGGQTALMHAAYHPFSFERFHFLVAAGADLNARRHDGMTGLHLACTWNDGRKAAEWLRAGANLDARTPSGATPLMVGAHHPAIVRMLLDARAEVNAVDDDGRSALVYAITCPLAREVPQTEALHALIDAGADVNLRDCQGVSPLGHAKKMVARVLLEEEVIQAFRPCFATTGGARSEEMKSAEAIVTLLIAAGARE